MKLILIGCAISFKKGNIYNYSNNNGIINQCYNNCIRTYNR